MKYILNVLVGLLTVAIGVLILPIVIWLLILYGIGWFICQFIRETKRQLNEKL